MTYQQNLPTHFQKPMTYQQNLPTHFQKPMTYPQNLPTHFQKPMTYPQNLPTHFQKPMTYEIVNHAAFADDLSIYDTWRLRTDTKVFLHDMEGFRV